MTKQNNEWVEYGVSPAGTSLGTKWVEQDVYINGSGLQLEKLRWTKMLGKCFVMGHCSPYIGRVV